MVVEELGADSPLVRLGAPAEVTPASLVKLLVAVAALSELGPEHRFETSVVRGASRHDVVLVGGGTLSGVHGLAGLVSTREGQTLMFAAVADEVPVRRALAARAQLDRIAALLASCGCTPQRR